MLTGLRHRLRASALTVAAAVTAAADQQRQVDTIGRQIGAVAVANYQRSQLTTTARLLLSADPDEFLRQASTAQAFTAQQTAILRRYQTATGKLADLKAGEETELQVMAAVQAEQNTLKAKIATNLAAAEKVLAKLTEAERDRLAAEDAAEVRQEEAEAQYNEGRRVSRAELQPGDLLFYYTPISHVSMYIGNGKAVHASRPGKPVKIDPAFGQMPYVGDVRPG